MRRFGAFALSLVLSFSGLARAEDQSELARLADHYGAGTRVARRADRTVRSERIAESTSRSSRVVEVMGHQIQTLLLMMIITGVEIVRSNIDIAHLKRENVSPDEIARMSAEAAEQILLGGGTWSSILGMGVVARTAKRPLAWLKSYIDGAVTRPILKSLLTSGITSFITFAGWEVGGQLFEEARELIDDDADYDRAANVVSRIFGAALSADDRRVLGLLLGNAFQIVVTDHELRSLWLYNAWRMRIATGHFATLVSSMVSAGAVGTAVFPGAGTIAGLGFGAVGGVLSLAVPERGNARITDDLAATRINYQIARAAQTFDSLDEVNQSVRSGVAGISPYVRSETTRLFGVINDALDAELSARFEIIHRQHARANVLSGNRRIAVDPADRARLDLDVAKTIIRRARGLRAAAAAVESVLPRVTAAYPGGPDAELKMIYVRELAELGRVALALRRLAEVTSPDDKDASRLITKIHLMGFRASYLN